MKVPLEVEWRESKIKTVRQLFKKQSGIPNLLSHSKQTNDCPCPTPIKENSVEKLPQHTMDRGTLAQLRVEGKKSRTEVNVPLLETDIHTPQPSSHTQLSEHCQPSLHPQDRKRNTHWWESDQPKRKHLTTLAVELPQQNGQAKSPSNEPNVSKTHPTQMF